mmetsp:Transcript_67143/g.216600  ORF Transcript_67143/g.216600 Transcript_67143/m.216600 type:complete len:208 (-) Transcript_67143:400-1023(-)
MLQPPNDAPPGHGRDRAYELAEQDLPRGVVLQHHAGRGCRDEDREPVADIPDELLVREGAAADPGQGNALEGPAEPLHEPAGPRHSSGFALPLALVLRPDAEGRIQEDEEEEAAGEPRVAGGHAAGGDAGARELAPVVVGADLQERARPGVLDQFLDDKLIEQHIEYNPGQHIELARAPLDEEYADRVAGHGVREVRPHDTGDLERR